MTITIAPREAVSPSLSPRPRPRFWRPLSLLALAAVGASIAAGAARIGLLVAVFVLVVPFERWFPRHPQRIRRPHLATDVAYALLAAPLGAIGAVVALVVGVASLAWIPGLVLRPLVLLLPKAARVAVGFVLFDFAVYWAHRFGHQVPFLWRFHSVHHSTRHLDWVSGFRVHPLDGAFVAPAFVLLLAAGFSARFAGVLAVLQALDGLFLHANVRWRWRPLQRVVATPEFHHWHHSSEAAAVNTNFAGFLPLWDLFFGTYRVPADRRPERYGVVGAAVPDGIAAQLWHPLRGLSNPLRELRHPCRALRRLARSVRSGCKQMARAAARPV